LFDGCNFAFVRDDFVWPFSSYFDVLDEFKGEKVIDSSG